MADFGIAVDLTLQHEGGYVNNSNDPGGETKYGISKRAFPDVDIANLTLDQAKEIYRRNYWNPLYRQIESQSVANKLFDMGVNMGRSVAVHILQDVLGVEADGIFGNGTLKALNASSAGDVLARYRAALDSHYRRIVAENPDTAKFLNGWLNRAAA